MTLEGLFGLEDLSRGAQINIGAKKRDRVDEVGGDKGRMWGEQLLLVVRH